MNEDPRLYEIAKRITFEAGFPTWTDPRTGETHRNPKSNKKGKPNGPSKSKKTKTASNNKEKPKGAS